MPTVTEIRDTIVANLKKNVPEFLWKTGEPLMDILDSVGEFHYKRGILENLTKAMTTPEGYRRLIYDTTFRTQLSAVLGLSLSQRSRTWIGVPSVVASDFDAFVWYYLDRFGENRGFRRGGGQIATGTCYLSYPAAVPSSATASVVFKNGSLIYKMDVDLNGPLETPATRKVQGVVYALGYGARYNLPAQSIRLDSVISTSGLVTTATISFDQREISGGSDYESNEKFLQRLIDATQAVSGLGTRANIATVLSQVSGIDKYLIKGTAANRRFLASADIYLKSGVREIWSSRQTVGDDGRVLVQYQPSAILLVNNWATGVAVKVDPSDYEIQTVTGDYEHSVRQVTYLDFTDAIAAGSVSIGDSVETKLLVNVPCVDANRQLNFYYGKFYESMRDWNIYETVDRSISVTMTTRLKSIVDPTLATTLIANAVTAYINNVPIEESIDYSDIINAVYGIYYNNDVLVDSVDTMTISTTDSTGTTYTLSAPGTIDLDAGETWVAATPVIEVV